MAEHFQRARHEDIEQNEQSEDTNDEDEFTNDEDEAEPEVDGADEDALMGGMKQLGLADGPSTELEFIWLHGHRRELPEGPRWWCRQQNCRRPCHLPAYVLIGTDT
jgi:hypothetical protein